MLTFYEWKSRDSITQLLGHAILILFFFVAWGLRIEHIFMTFIVCISFTVFRGKTSKKSAPEHNSEPQKVYAYGQVADKDSILIGCCYGALTNAYIQCVENKMPVRKAAKLYNIPHTTLRDRLSRRVHIDTLLLHIETVLFPPILYFMIVECC